jgi:hypothetical protein
MIKRFSFLEGDSLVPCQATFPKEKRLRSRGRTKSVVSESSMMDESDDLSHWRHVFAMFISGSSAALAHPYFYLLQTNSKWSLCLLSGLPPSIYSALLLKCKLVKIIRGDVVIFDNKQWDVFQTSTGRILFNGI